jgi:hypothetical protein
MSTNIIQIIGIKVFFNYRLFFTNSLRTYVHSEEIPPGYSLLSSHMYTVTEIHLTSHYVNKKKEEILNLYYELKSRNYEEMLNLYYELKSRSYEKEE